jgi:hypothetical protein
MAIRVLATFPELPSAAEPIPAPVEAAGPPPRPASPPPPRRTRSRAAFPGVSVAALAVMAAAIWSLVAIREAVRPGTEPDRPRLAAGPVDATAAETTIR